MNYILNLNIFRFFTYRAEKAHYYMIDFCYIVNLSAILQTLLCGCEGSLCGQWFQLNYILTQGPIATAIVLWGNSLVFHSLDKVTIITKLFLIRVPMYTLLGKIIRLSLNQSYSRSPVLLSIFFLQCYIIS